MRALPPLPSFEDFYSELHGRAPFPWQRRLAELVRAGPWPREIGVPTGVGKTSAIDIAVWALAADAGAEPSARLAPTRVWYVVDRRLLIDAATDHAIRLRDRLMGDCGGGAVAAVGERLRALGAVDGRPPLWVARLRGGTAQDLVPPDPAQPAVICSTVDMFASRLLFRGYGVSRSMWPIHAAHAGIDSLILLDEAHLAECLQQMIEVLPEADANHGGVLRFPGRFSPTAGPASVVGELRSRPTLVSLTATGAVAAADRFDLDAEDHAHPVVAERLAAAKPTRLVESTIKDLAQDLASTAVDLVASCSAGQGGSPAVLVFVNSPVAARNVAECLDRLRSEGDVEVVTLTGQLRAPDAERVRTRLLDQDTGCPSGATPQRDRPLVIIATQTLEVGADLDVDALVSETADVRAIIQRWGRLNRLGHRPWAQAVLVHPVDRKPGGLYGDEPELVWDRLRTLPEDVVDLGPARIADVLGPPGRRQLRAGQLLGTHLWEFAKTAVPPQDAAPPHVFFRPLDDEDRGRLSVAWRVTAPVVERDAVSGCEKRTLVAPVVASETVEIPVADLRDFLEDPRMDSAPAWLVGDDGESLIAIDASELRPGQVVVLDVSLGGYGPSGWDPGGRSPVADLAPLIHGSQWLTVGAMENLLGRDLSDEERLLIAQLDPAPDAAPEELDDPEVHAQIKKWFRSEAHGIVDFDRVTEVAIERRGTEQVPVLRVRWADRRPTYVADALDELSNAPSATLTDHLRSVAEMADRLAEAIGVPDELRRVVTDAGRFHDLGKADPRFQRRLGNSDPSSPPVAKSGQTTRQRFEALARSSGWPRGARHELLSVQLLDAALAAGAELAEPDLLRHLVISHHGHGRPSCPIAGSGAVTVSLQIDHSTLSASCDPGVEDLDQPARFRTLCERFGFWGLALLEAIVRQADHVVSRATPAGDRSADVEVV